MTSAQAKNLTVITVGVLGAGTFLTHHYATTSPKPLAKPLIAIGLIWIIMSVMADQVPDFAGPFALLVLVAYWSTHLDIFNEFAGNKEKSK